MRLGDGYELRLCMNFELRLKGPDCLSAMSRGVKFPNKLLALHAPNLSLRCYK